MSDEYPALNALGITSPNEIERYVLETLGNVDVLRVIYKRKKGSLRPSSKKYRIGRQEHTVVTNSASGATETIHEASPYLTDAVADLDKIINQTLSRNEKINIILDEIQRLEDENKSRISHIKSLIKECI